MLNGSSPFAFIRKKDFDYITIKEICEKAGVNRSTFYLHYETMQDLLLESIDFLFNQLQSKYEGLISQEKIQNAQSDELLFFTPKFSTPYLEFIKENKKAFMSAVNNQNLFRVDITLNSLYNKFYNQVLSKHKIPSNERAYYLKFYLSGIHAIIIEWIKNGCKEDISFIADLIEKCVSGKREQ